jgi:LmbE family N-acetylglucosaminyl deacetylase
MTVIVVAPHPDDEAIGCGGTLLRHSEFGEVVHVAFMTSGELGLAHLEPAEAWQVRESEAAAAVEVLGVSATSFLRLPDWYLEQHVETAVRRLSEIVEHLGPRLVYVPHAGEWHPDHRASFSVTLAAAARCGLPSSALRCYEVWTPLASCDVVEDVTERMPRKLEAIRCYASQLSEFDYVQAAIGLAQYRGALAARTRYAEVFGHCTEDQILSAAETSGATAAEPR